MKRVLFLCIGNSCRSPMAEGFAKRYGSDVLKASSAGTAPASIVQPLTRKVMSDKNISIDEYQTKDLMSVDFSQIDTIINMSGRPVPSRGDIEVVEWKVEDPIGKDESVYVSVRDQIEMLVMRLVLDTRRTLNPRQPRTRSRRAELAATKEDGKNTGGKQA